MKRALKVDDSLDVFPVHGVGGMLGTLAAGVFASTGLGLFSGQGYAEGMSMANQMGVQLLGIVAIAAYTGVLSFVLLKLVDAVIGVRVSAEDETSGLDTSQHNERGYDL
jgi:Amt family ammonium transporter